MRIVVCIALVVASQFIAKDRLTGTTTTTDATNPIAASRQVDWSQTKGVLLGRAPSDGWSQCVTAACNTLTAAGTGATVAQINSAIASASANTYVKLGAGTYSLSGLIDFDDKDNVELRGAGATTTNLVFTNSTSCRGFDAVICLADDTNPSLPTPASTTTWTAANYNVGQTTITVASATGIAVGDMLALDQLNDSTTDTGGVWVCTGDNLCTDEGGNAHGRSNRGQQQYVKVTAKSGNDLTITPGLYMPNWSASKTPGLFHNAGSKIENSGVRDLTIDIRNAQLATGNSGGSAICTFWGYNLWVQGVAIIQGAGTGGDRNLIRFYETAASVIRDSYWDGCPVDDVDGCHSTAYGVELFSTSDILIENNIFRRQPGGITVNGATAGTVIAYNYCPDQYYFDGVTMIACTTLHEVGISHILFEGNHFTGITSDQIHGTHNFVTFFRNRLIGRDGSYTNNTGALRTYAGSRYYNVVGNVLGLNAVSFNYISTSSPMIIGNGLDGCSTPCSSFPSGTDSRVVSTMMIWGNYDTANDATRWNASEVPSGLSDYPNPVPSNQLLPNSLYLSAKPAWWSNAGATLVFPAIGPDVTGGDETGVGGHVAPIPARSCYTNATKDANGIMTNFNAGTCYP